MIKQSLACQEGVEGVLEELSRYSLGYLRHLFSVKEMLAYRLVTLANVRFYLELMEHGIEDQKIVNEGLLKISQDLQIPVVVTNDVHYLEQSQFKAQEALLCIQTQTLLNDPNRMRLKTDQFYFKDPALMKKEFSWIPEALKNTLEIADKCNLELRFDQYHLPNYEPPS